jgi:uncharacterized spore protein YtfJ
MEVQDVIGQARDALTIKRVFGEPYEKDGVTVIPAARVQGGAGAGRRRGSTGPGHRVGQRLCHDRPPGRGVHHPRR